MHRWVWVALCAGVSAFAAIPVSARSPTVLSSLVEVRLAVDTDRPENSRVVTVDGVAGGLVLLSLDGGVSQTVPLPAWKTLDTRSRIGGAVLVGASPSSSLLAAYLMRDGGFDTTPVALSSQALPTRVALLQTGQGVFRVFVETATGTLSEFALNVTAAPPTLTPTTSYVLPGSVLAMAADDVAATLYLSVQNSGLGHLVDGGFVVDVAPDAGVVSGLSLIQGTDAGVLFAALSAVASPVAYRVGGGALTRVGTLEIAGTPAVSAIAVSRQGPAPFTRGVVAVNDVPRGTFTGTVALLSLDDVVAAVPGLPLASDAGSSDAGRSDGGSAGPGGLMGGGGGDETPAPASPCGCHTSSALCAFLLAPFALFRRRKESP